MSKKRAIRDRVFGFDSVGFKRGDRLSVKSPAAEAELLELSWGEQGFKARRIFVEQS